MSQLSKSMSKDDDIEFIDAENYTPAPEGAISYEQLVLEQIRRCVVEGSKEMIGGYMQTKITSRGNVEIYIPDQREVYVQCVSSLYDLLLSFFDDIMWDAVDGFSDEMSKAKEDKISRLRDKIVIAVDNRIKKQLHYQIETGFLDRDSPEARALLEEKVDLYRELFQDLILLYSRKRYLMSESITA